MFFLIFNAIPLKADISLTSSTQKCNFYSAQNEIGQLYCV